MDQKARVAICLLTNSWKVSYLQAPSQTIIWRQSVRFSSSPISSLTEHLLFGTESNDERVEKSNGTDTVCCCSLFPYCFFSPIAERKPPVTSAERPTTNQPNGNQLTVPITVSADQRNHQNEGNVTFTFSTRLFIFPYSLFISKFSCRWNR